MVFGAFLCVNSGKCYFTSVCVFLTINSNCFIHANFPTGRSLSQKTKMLQASNKCLARLRQCCMRGCRGVLRNLYCTVIWKLPWFTGTRYDVWCKAFLLFYNPYFKTTLDYKTTQFGPKVLNDLYFKTTCNIRPHFLGHMGGLTIEELLYTMIGYLFCNRCPGGEIQIHGYFCESQRSSKSNGLGEWDWGWGGVAITADVSLRFPMFVLFKLSWLSCIEPALLYAL